MKKKFALIIFGGLVVVIMCLILRIRELSLQNSTDSENNHAKNLLSSQQQILMLSQMTKFTLQELISPDVTDSTNKGIRSKLFKKNTPSLCLFVNRMICDKCFEIEFEKLRIFAKEFGIENINIFTAVHTPPLEEFKKLYKLPFQVYNAQLNYTSQLYNVRLFYFVLDSIGTCSNLFIPIENDQYVNSEIYFSNIRTLFNAINNESNLDSSLKTNTIIQPNRIDLGIIKQGSTLFKDLQIYNNGESDLIIRDVKSSNPMIKVRWPLLPIKAKSNGVIQFKILIDKYHSEQLKESITISSNSNADSVVTIFGRFKF